MKVSILSGLLLIWTTLAFAQAPLVLRGRVLAKPDMRVLSSASVFLSNTTLGAVCDQNGFFELTGLKAGNYRLVVSYVGYETQILEVQPSQDKVYVIALTPVATMLPDVVVTDGNIKRQKTSLEDLKTFRDYFIGLSANANGCTILNEPVLRFKDTAGILHAYADSTLIILNRSLGYRVKFILEDFKYNKALKTVYYRGQTIFEKLTPSDSAEQHKFARNRLTAYAGSQLHFMRSLFNGTLTQEGFYVTLKYQRDALVIQGNRAARDTVIKVKTPLFKQDLRVATLVNFNSILDSARSLPDQPFLAFNGMLEINYVNESEPSAYLRLRDQRNVGYTLPQKSALTLSKDGVAIEPTGMVLMEENLISHGYWCWELVAESLPVDYDPDDDRKLLEKHE
jgi:hypothetical protein